MRGRLGGVKGQAARVTYVHVYAPRTRKPIPSLRSPGAPEAPELLSGRASARVTAE